MSEMSPGDAKPLSSCSNWHWTQACAYQPLLSKQSEITTKSAKQAVRVCILFLVFFNLITSQYFFANLCLFLSEKD